MSTTYKSLGIGFLAGVVSTGLFALGVHVPGAVLWGISLAVIGYEYREAKKGG